MKRASLRHFLHLLSYALRYRRLVLTQFALMAISVSFGLLKPWPLKVLMDHVVPGKPLVISLGGLGGLWHGVYQASFLLPAACVAFLLLSVGEALVQLGSSTVATLSSAQMIRDLRANLLRGWKPYP
jgi:hypothetical protein